MRFESDVISDGTQTYSLTTSKLQKFESDVISDGTQTLTLFRVMLSPFESDVISDGTQTNHVNSRTTKSLRVM